MTRTDRDTRPGIASLPFRLVMAATLLGFAGYSLLLPVVPLWTARGGSGELGAGATTGVLMLATVATQLAVPWMITRAGHRAVLVAGLVLLGAPSPLLVLSADLLPVLAVSTVRGIGFGMLTVVGSALVAELVAPAEHGRAAARYGVAVGAPQLALLPAGVAVVEAVGFPVVFLAAGITPLLGAVLALGVRPPAGRRPAGTAERRARGLGRAAAGPVLAMIVCATAQGGLVTFLPLAAPGTGAAIPAALFGTAAGAIAGRLVAGRLVDRRGMGGRLLLPGVLLTAAGMATEIAAVAADPARPALLVTGAVVVGLGFGLVQNDSLTALFAAAGTARYGAASAAWNIAYDAGTGIGAVGLGALAQPFGFATAFGAAAVLLVLVAPVTRGAVPGAGRAR
ncbi:MAG TPA: MFS transporter [Pseudonocardia sp.]|nr:MFS transporter [Pseudonocardia sp.]